MHYKRKEMRAFLLVMIMHLICVNARGDLPGATKEFEKITGIVAAGSYRRISRSEDISLVDQVGFPMRSLPKIGNQDGFWHFLLTDVTGISSQDAEFLSNVTGRGISIHPIFLSYVERKFKSKNPDLPVIYLSIKGDENLDVRIGSKFTLANVVLLDVGIIPWELTCKRLLSSYNRRLSGDRVPDNK